MAELEIVIGGDSRELAKEIDRVEKQLRDLTAQKTNNIKLGLDNSDVILKINQAKKELKGYTTQLNSTASASQDFNKATSNGSNTLTQFSRIAQDAPFGIIGIGNNLTATFESFNHLSKSAGGATNALKAVGSSLLGGGGVLLAISLVTTGLTYMSQQGLTVGDVFDKLSGTFNASRREMQEMSQEVVKNSTAEITSVGALVSVAQNLNLSYDERKIAVDKLQSTYPAYFGNLSQEEILNGNVKSAVEGVTKAIIAKAKAASLVDKIVKLSEEETQLQNDLKNELAKVARGYQLNKKEAYDFAKAVFAGGDAFKLLEPYKKRAGFFDVANAVSLNNTIEQINLSIKNNKAEQDKLTKSVNESTAAYIKLEAKTPKKPKAAKEVNTKEPIIEFKSFLKPITADQLKPFDNAINEAVNTSIIQNVAVQTDEFLQLLVDFNQEASQIIQGGLVDTFSGIGEAIGGALAGGTNVLEAAGASLLSSLGGILVQLGQLAIQTGVGILAVKTALKTLNPFVAIAAGAALVTLGSAFKGKAAKIGNSGGSSSGGSTSGRDYSSPASSSSTGGGGGFSNGTVVFEISGNSLIGVLSNTLDKNSRLGGSLGI